MAWVQYDAWQHGYRGIVPAEFLARQSLQRGITRWSQHWDGTLLVENDAGTVVGISSCGAPRDDGQDASVGELYMINLASSAWGTGVARPLFDAAVQRLREAGYASAYLWVLEPNLRARRFYEKAGWAADGGTKLHEPSRVMEIRYRCEL